MRYFIIAGEKSGDLHGSNLIRELIKADHNALIRCWGGDLMKSAGAELLVHYSKTAFMGFAEVLKNIETIKENMNLCKSQILSFNPDVIILIDYPGFNLRIAEFAKKRGILIYYYISPKLWAWKESRIKKVKSFVDRMYIIFPFEISFYKKHNITAYYFGNPLLDETERYMRNFRDGCNLKENLGLTGKPVIALLAGSRKSEVKHVLPFMMKIVKDFSGYQFVVAGVKSLPEGLYGKILKHSGIKVIYDRTYELLSISDAAIVTSGTATLETALLKIPQVVCFRGDFFSMLIAWMVIKVKYISLVNLISGNEVVKELVQYSLNRKNLAKELRRILPGGDGRNKMMEDYKHFREILGPPGASERVAADIVKCLSEELKKVKS